MKKENVSKVPETLAECFVALSQLLSDGEQDRIMMIPEKDLCLFHHGLGRFIRNEWGLWAGGPLKDHFKNLGFIHPDDVSSTIIEAYRAHLRKETFDINSKIKYYKEYWDKVDNEQRCSD